MRERQQYAFLVRAMDLMCADAGYPLSCIPFQSHCGRWKGDAFLSPKG